MKLKKEFHVQLNYIPFKKQQASCTCTTIVYYDDVGMSQYGCLLFFTR